MITVILKNHSADVVEVLYKGNDPEQYLVENKDILQEDIDNRLISVQEIESFALDAEDMTYH